MDFCKVKRSLFYVEQLYDEKWTRNTLLISQRRYRKNLPYSALTLPMAKARRVSIIVSLLIIPKNAL